MNEVSNKKRRPNPRETASPLSNITFFYTISTFIEGFRRDLEEDDLPETLNAHKSGKLGNEIERLWKKEVKRASKLKIRPSLLRVLLRLFGLKLLFYSFVLMISDAAKIIQPLFLGQFLNYYVPNQTDIPKRDAYLCAAGIVLSSLINILITSPYSIVMAHIGMKMRIACCSLIYRKSLKLSRIALDETTVGQIVNLLSNDVNRFDLVLYRLNNLWLAPIEIVVCTYLMYFYIGISAVIGVAFLVLLIPLQMLLARIVSRLRLATALKTDERIRLMNEIISGIQVIKMYAWEKSFAKLISLARKYEISQIRKVSYLRAITNSMSMFVSRVSIFASILPYLLLGNIIKTDKLFIVTSYYNILTMILTVLFSQGILQLAETFISIGRINKFLLLDEKPIQEPTKIALETDDDIKKNLIQNEIGVMLKDVTAKWRSNSIDNTLNQMCLEAKPGKLVAIIGPVGSGKSSILNVILKELPIMHGEMRVNGVISYASQDPWLFAGSIRQNILFGLPMNKLRYEMVVNQCALLRDLAILPYGDKTVVGDRGVSLSGGQRARINLARAIYREADIYLLDDPLSAVDVRVGKQLFDNCISKFLSNKLVILVTHQLQYLKEIDNIIYIEDGCIRMQGNFNQIISSGLDFTKLVINQHSDDKDEDEERRLVYRRESIRSVTSVDPNDIPEIPEDIKGVGSVSHTYTAYFKAGGNFCRISILLVFFLLTPTISMIADYFITFWVNSEQDGTISKKSSTLYAKWWHITRDFALHIYSLLIGLLIINTLIRSLYFIKVCMRASKRLHDKMFVSISRATMRFFNENTCGRILNRFSKDIGAIDELLPAVLIDCLQIGLNLFSVICIICIVNTWLILPTALLLLVLFFLRRFYVRTSRMIKRLEGVTRSPVFTHLNASLQGLTTIRAFNSQIVLENEFDAHQDLHSSAWFSFISTSRAFAYWLDLTSVVYIALVTFSFLLIGNEKYGGNVGLAVTQAISITGMLQWGMRQSTELENQMTSVERVLQYKHIEHESELESASDKKPPKTWPEYGEIIFRNVYLRYSPEGSAMLKNLNFTIKPKEKIGIVGRTGAGKSSIINAIFQITQTEGQILIDQVDISQIGLHDLRSKISIIPQEPVLFSGTLRRNLDPFNEYTDDDLWRALEDVELKETVVDLVSGLDAKISEGGTNFSVGQRQLVCLARAILRNNKVLVLDEATANVDPHTDALIQTTIRVKFSECTVLTIAHRLQTVMDSDKVMVMDGGTLKEYDHAYLLLQKTDGTFYELVQKTGAAMADHLYEIAKTSYSNKL